MVSHQNGDMVQQPGNGQAEYDGNGDKYVLVLGHRYRMFEKWPGSGSTVPMNPSPVECSLLIGGRILLTGALQVLPSWLKAVKGADNRRGLAMLPMEAPLNVPVAQ